MKVSILFFGRLIDKTGKDKLEVEDFSNLNDVLNYLKTNFPALSDEVFKVAVNQNFVDENISLNSGDEIALMPPFAGG